MAKDPTWSMEILMDILDYEDTHESFGNAKQDGRSVVCFAKTLEKVPDEMKTAADILRAFLREKGMRE